MHVGLKRINYSFSACDGNVKMLFKVPLHKILHHRVLYHNLWKARFIAYREKLGHNKKSIIMCWQSLYSRQGIVISVLRLFFFLGLSGTGTSLSAVYILREKKLNFIHGCI